MSEQLTRKFRMALASEIQTWQTDALIDRQTADLLKARYPILPQSSRVVTILLIVGAALVGLGMLLFVSANWIHLTRLAKVSIILGAMLSAYIGAWHCKYEPGERPKLGSALLLVGTLIYGAGIWLVSQIFNFDTELSTGLFLWIVGTAAVSWTTRSGLITILLAALVPAWNISIVHDAALPLRAGEFALSMAALSYVCCLNRSRCAGYVMAIGGLLWSCTNENYYWFGPIMLGTSLVAAHLQFKDKFPALCAPFLHVGTVGILGGLLMGTFQTGHHFDYLECLTVVGTFFALTTVPVMLICSQKGVHQTELKVIGAIALGACLLQLLDAEALRIGLMNLSLIGAIVATMAAGIRWQRVSLVNSAIVFIIIDIIARYCDMFYSTMDRSIFFVVGGAILLTLGAIAEKNRRKLTGSFYAA